MLLWDFLHSGPWQTRKWHEALDFIVYHPLKGFLGILTRPTIHNCMLFGEVLRCLISCCCHMNFLGESAEQSLTCWSKHLALQIVLVICRWARLPNEKTMSMKTNVALPLAVYPSSFGFHIGFQKQKTPCYEVCPITCSKWLVFPTSSMCRVALAPLSVDPKKSLRMDKSNF